MKTNGQRYLTQINYALNRDQEYLANFMMRRVGNEGTYCDIYKRFMEWMMKPITITDTEYIILSNVDETYGWISRLPDGSLVLTVKREELEGVYNLDEAVDLAALGVRAFDMYDDLFSVIEHGECFNIDQLLKDKEDEREKEGNRKEI